jgi:hypothetical protein
MHKKFLVSLVAALVLLAAISGIAFAGSIPQPSPLSGAGQQVVTMTPSTGVYIGTPQPGIYGTTMTGSTCPMMSGSSGMTGMTGMTDMTGMTGMTGMTDMSSMDMTGTTSTMNMAAMDDTQVILSDPSTWVNNPWTMLGWLLVLVAFLAILIGIVLGVVWIVRHAMPARPA